MSNSRDRLPPRRSKKMRTSPYWTRASISTVSEGGKLQIEMRVKNGRGYVAADRNYDEDLPIGYIPVDSVHSPVRKVNYSVEAARLGQMTDYEKLMLEVWTNGAIT